LPTHKGAGGGGGAGQHAPAHVPSITAAQQPYLQPACTTTGKKIKIRKIFFKASILSIYIFDKNLY
jgi:hypothetical protein